MAHMAKVLKQGLKDMKISRLVDDQIEKKVDDVSYPWGLRLTLAKQELDALGLNASRFEIEGEVCLECRATVVSIRKDKSGHGNSETVELQVTHLGFEEED